MRVNGTGCKCNRTLERGGRSGWMVCLENTKWRPWTPAFSFHYFYPSGQRALFEPLDEAANYLFSIYLFPDCELLSWRETWQPSLWPLFVTSPKLIISIDDYCFWIRSYLITGNLDIEFQRGGTAWSFIAASGWQMFPLKAILVIALVEKNTVLVFALREL